MKLAVPLSFFALATGSSSHQNGGPLTRLAAKRLREKQDPAIRDQIRIRPRPSEDIELDSMIDWFIKSFSVLPTSDPSVNLDGVGDTVPHGFANIEGLDLVASSSIHTPVKTPARELPHSATEFAPFSPDMNFFKRSADSISSTPDFLPKRPRRFAEYFPLDFSKDFPADPSIFSAEISDIY